MPISKRLLAIFIALEAGTKVGFLVIENLATNVIKYGKPQSPVKIPMRPTVKGKSSSVALLPSLITSFILTAGHIFSLGAA